MMRARSFHRYIRISTGKWNLMQEELRQLRAMAQSNFEVLAQLKVTDQETEEMVRKVAAAIERRNKLDAQIAGFEKSQLDTLK